MPEDPWDPASGIMPPTNNDALDEQASAMPPDTGPQSAAPRVQSAEHTSGEHRMTGGAAQPNNAQELAEDDVDQAALESFPASDPPSWTAERG